MKAIITKLSLVLIVAVMFSSCSVFQKGGSDGFQGIITYEVNYESDELSAADRAQLPTEVIVYVADNKVRQDQNTAMYSISQISDYNDGSTIVLIDAMGQKIAVKQSKEEMDEALSEMEVEDPVINFIDEAKEIAGYRSKKAEVEMDGEIVEVFFTDELDVPEKMNELNGFKGINGLLMEYTVVQQGLISTMKVKEINKTKVKPHMFRIPDDYDVKSPEELGGLFGM
jgi:GLPGLI family protein